LQQQGGDWRLLCNFGSSKTLKMEKASFKEEEEAICTIKGPFGHKYPLLDHYMAPHHFFPILSQIATNNLL